MVITTTSCACQRENGVLVVPLANFTECETAINVLGIYTHISPRNPNEWDMKRFISDLMMINLGTNDEFGKFFNFDSLCKWRVVRSVKDLKELLFVDKRIDEDEFGSCDFGLMKRLAGLYDKTNFKLLIKLIEKEHEHE